MKPHSYNPLDYKSLSEALARELMSSELTALADVERFYGNGVYALFYSGDFGPYRELARVNRGNPGSLPIYIGKAGPKTAKGIDLDAGAIDSPDAGTRLYERIAGDHRKSIENAVNLDVADFTCRLLVLNAIWVPLTESALIGEYTPVWNSIITGFGNHQQGSGRSKGKPSRWDILHPGRKMDAEGATDSTYDALAEEASSAIHERIRILGLSL